MQSGHQHGKGLSPLPGGPNVGIPNSENIHGEVALAAGPITMEEDILTATLLELTATGWKSDNGFRAGYLSKIEDSLCAEFPSTDLKGNPFPN
ncbi:hypothetical protein SASPL_104954 [Salvia splendens]|uniref:Uncharacterized protein n=1 Tax=Salvia splendens TaxID=180675 RepID=A0A8X8YKU6_SALSN|nr:hypothetical protein SASPL_104954 [Salvia splendens]